MSGRSDMDLAIGLARPVVPLVIIDWPVAIIACLILDAVDQSADRHQGPIARSATGGRRQS